MMGTWKRISTALGLFLGLAATTLAQTANQTTADSVAAVLRSHPGLAASKITIEAREGQVTLAGVVLSPALKQEEIARTRQVLGVTSVSDRLAVGDPRVLTARYQSAQPGMVTGIPGMGVQGGTIPGGTVANAAAGTMLGGNAPVINGGYAGAPGVIGNGNFAGTGAPMMGFDPTGHSGSLDGRPAGHAELRVAQLRPLPQLLGRRVPDRLPLAGLAEHRPLPPLS